MLFVVWVGACWPFVWVMAVGVGVFGFWWCCFQYCVAVVFASRRVPGVGVCVLWLVFGVCSGVGWLVCVLWWFRMLMCSGLFLVFLVLFVLLITVCVPGGGVCGVKEWLVLVWGCFCLCLLACACKWRGGGVCGLVCVWVKGVWGLCVWVG